MHAFQLCQSYFKKTSTSFHGSRKTILQGLVVSLLCGADLSLTSLGRHLSGAAYVKHKIKRTDRFLGNGHVYHELPLIYQEMLAPLLTSLDKLVIAVDWSGCCTRDYHVLRASLLYQGRSIPLYNVVVEEALQESVKVHDRFLETLKYKILPMNASVTIVTDGGFKTPWLEKVRGLGWEFVARMRGRIHCQLVDGDWQPIQTLHHYASHTPRYLGEGLLGKTCRTPCRVHFFTMSQRSKGRKGSHRVPPQKQANCSRSQTEPWVIVTSLSGGKKIIRTVMGLYKKRMQIEQNFRDDKNPRWGFSWRYSRTRDVARLSILCLIASLATLILWFIGFMAETKQYHYRFQANTVKHKRVLSYLFLAKQFLFHYPDKIPRHTLTLAINTFANIYRQEEVVACLP